MELEYALGRTHQTYFYTVIQTLWCSITDSSAGYLIKCIPLECPLNLSILHLSCNPIDWITFCRLASCSMYFPRSFWLILSNVLKLSFLWVTNPENILYLPDFFVGDSVYANWPFSSHADAVQTCGDHSVSYCRVSRYMH